MGKKVEKKRVKPVASEGDAVAGKEGFGKDMEWKWVGMGRGPARPRSSSGWAGGLNRQSRNHRPPIHSEGLVRMVLGTKNQ